MSSNGDNLGFEQKLWQAADKMRNNMDAAEYKHLVLGLIFLKYISDAFKEVYDELKQDLAIFENYNIRRIYDEDIETWFFSVVDIIKVLIQQPDFQTARKYWNKLKERLKEEG